MADVVLPDPADTRFLAGAKMPVVSSNVAWLEYQEGTLTIGYQNGGEYYCENVKPALALEIRKAKSVGKALYALQQERGSFKRVQR